MAKRNAPDATKKDLVPLRKRIDILERKMRNLERADVEFGKALNKILDALQR